MSPVRNAGARTGQPLAVGWSQAAAFRLTRHHLAERAPKRALVSVVSDMAGAQAQLLSAAQIALWPRVRDLSVAEVNKAVAARKLVKAACMRRTLFLVPAAELAIFVRGAAGRAEKEIRWARGKGVPGRAIDAAIDATLDVLNEPLTRPEIAERVARALGVQSQAIHGGGWGRRSRVAAVPVGHLTYPVVDLLHLAGARGVVCYGPNRGAEPTFVRADAWLPQWNDLAQEAAEDALLRKYLAAYGPATPPDFAMWSGLTITGALRIWARAESAIAPVDVEGWAAYVLRRDLGALADARIARPLVRLLPFFDTFLLGHRERDHLLSARLRPRVYRPQGWIAPAVLLDGRVAGVWEHSRAGNQLRVRVAGFETLSARAAARVRAEARDLGRFLGAPVVEVVIK